MAFADIVTKLGGCCWPGHATVPASRWRHVLSPLLKRCKSGLLWHQPSMLSAVGAASHLASSSANLCSDCGLGQPCIVAASLRVMALLETGRPLLQYPHDGCCRTQSCGGWGQWCLTSSTSAALRRTPRWRCAWTARGLGEPTSGDMGFVLVLAEDTERQTQLPCRKQVSEPCSRLQRWTSWHCCRI